MELELAASLLLLFLFQPRIFTSATAGRHVTDFCLSEGKRGRKVLEHG